MKDESENPERETVMLHLNAKEMREVQEMSVKLGLNLKATMMLAITKGAPILTRALKRKGGQ